MLDCTFVLSARWADNTEIVASGTVVGADEAELVSVMLDRHHEDICSVGGTIGGDVGWGIEQWGEAEALEPCWRHNRDHDVLTFPIPCRTACPDHPDAEAPQVQLTATFVPWVDDGKREPPTTVIGAFLRQFGKQPKRSRHPARSSDLATAGRGHWTRHHGCGNA